jgi:hypothetical protein
MYLLESQKHCCRCHLIQDVSQFTLFKDLEKGTLHGYCRTCHAKWNREHYLRNRNTYIATARRNNAIYMAENARRVIEYLMAHPCVDCGERDPVVLEFDHRDPASKSVEVGNLLHRGGSWTAVEAEIAKCDVRCANCHRRRTAQQFGWRKAALAGLVGAGASGIEPETSRFGDARSA